MAFRYFTDFINIAGASTIENAMFATNSGSGSNSNNTPVSNGHLHPGVVASNPGTTSTGRAAVTSAIQLAYFGGGEWTFETLVNVVQLSNASDRFQFVIGFIGSNTTVTQSNAVAFLYDEGAVSTGATAATYWQTLTAASGSRTYNNGLTQTTVNANTWVKLKIVVNAAGTSVDFYINDTKVATHTTNIPTSLSQAVGFGWLTIKSAGTNQIATYTDYLSVAADFSSRRY